MNFLSHQRLKEKDCGPIFEDSWSMIRASLDLRFRPSYPLELCSFVSGLFPRKKPACARISLLDFGSGTGQVVEALLPSLSRATLVDFDNAMLYEARNRFAASSLSLSFECCSSETFNPNGKSDLITFGRCFHLMDRQLMLRRCTNLLTRNGWCLILGDAPLSSGPQRKDGVTIKTLAREWMRHHLRSSESCSSSQVSALTHEEVLEQFSPREVQNIQIPYERVWSIEAVVGFLLTTCICSGLELGSRQEEFISFFMKEIPLFEVEGKITEKGFLRVLAVRL